MLQKALFEKQQFQEVPGGFGGGPQASQAVVFGVRWAISTISTEAVEEILAWRWRGNPVGKQREERTPRAKTL